MLDIDLSDYKFFITGVNGMVGKSLAAAVLHRGGHVQGHVSFEDKVSMVASLTGDITLSFGDLCSVDVVNGALKSFESIDRPHAIVFHGAAISDDTICEQNPTKALQINVQMVDMILAELTDKKITQVIFPSTAYVYGTLHQTDVEEDEPLKPQSIYPMTKMMAESIVNDAAKKYNLSAQILRISNIYSEDVKPGTVIDAVLSQIKSGHIAMRNLKPVRDFIHLDDVVEAILRLSIKSSNAGTNIYNLSTGRGVSVRQIVDICLNAAGIKDAKVTADFETESQLVLNNNRLTQFLNWEPSISFEEGMARALN